MSYRLVELARSAKRLPHLVLAVVLAPTIILVSQLSGALLFLPVQANVDREYARAHPLLDGAIFAYMLVVLFSGIFLLLWAWLKWFEKRPLATLGFEAPAAFRKYARGFMVGVGLFSLAVVLLAALGALILDPAPTAATGWAAAGGVLAVLLGWMVQGAAEEALVRGWLMNVVSARYRLWVGILVSSLVFAALHGLNNGVALLPLINLVLFSLFVAGFTLWDESLWGVAAAHSAWNWVQGNAFGLYVSGNPAAGGSLLRLIGIGPDLLTGGAFGPEGGLAVTTALVVGIIIIGGLLARQRRTSL